MVEEIVMLMLCVVGKEETLLKEAMEKYGTWRGQSGAVLVDSKVDD